MRKRILYVAFHFPPIQTSSGVHRTLAFTRYFSEQGDEVTVLTVPTKAYQHFSEQNLSLIPAKINVLRCYARDTATQFAFKNKYFSWMALPDRWQSWIIGGFIGGLKHIRKNRSDVIVSTYPIASAHFIGFLLHKVTGIPWIADFRDPMLQDDYPANPKVRKLFGWIEKKAAKHCRHIIFTSPGALKLYQERYPEVAPDVWQVLPNGYDEALFGMATAIEQPKTDNKVTLLHSGTIYPSERDPLPFFNAIAYLKKNKPQLYQKLNVVLRSTGHDTLFLPILKQLEIDDAVTLAPALNYVEALEEMLTTDALLLMQASNCNYQTPAKAYEYIRAKKPVLALTDADGDTAQLIMQSQVAELAPLDDSAKICSAIENLISNLEHEKYRFLPQSQIATFSREHQAERFRQLLLKL
ncbi:glycosyltransferase [Arsukibacterium perlucidum]|uniref:glycosyltransferase n=1 Tax=Arsukibacterium perlucidum TaxID=368811 RepID=UPI000360D60D|nr:glycosyltransferase [Arsukibacterium perlucidum]